MVRVRAYAKVNLTLEITGAEGGYHLLDSLVMSVDLYDLVCARKHKGKLSTVKMMGMGSESIPPEKNNALKAAEAFSKRFGVDGAEITVYKKYPDRRRLGRFVRGYCRGAYRHEKAVRRDGRGRDKKPCE